MKRLFAQMFHDFGLGFYDLYLSSPKRRMLLALCIIGAWALVLIPTLLD